MVFIPSKKLSLFLRYSNFKKFSPSFPHFPDPKQQMEWNKLWCHELTCIKPADVIFGITQKPLYII